MKTLCLVLLVLAPSADYTPRKLSAKKAGFYESNATYLEFKGSHPLASVINPLLKKQAENEQKEWIKQATDAQKELGKPTAAWEHEYAVEVAYNTPRLVSLITSIYDYSGGAHPNHWNRALNFGFVNGKPGQIKLSSFFESGFNCDAHISKLVIAQLKKREGADLVKDGEITKLTREQLQNFTVSATALTWYFNPYEVGPYAAGDFEVKLTARELGPKFKSSMLRGR